MRVRNDVDCGELGRGRGLAQYNANMNVEDAWKAKDSAVYLLTARGSTTQVSSG